MSRNNLVSAVQDKGEPCRWDCETILSTCSNLDNHPRLIVEPSRGQKKRDRASAPPGEKVPTPSAPSVSPDTGAALPADSGVCVCVCMSVFPILCRRWAGGLDQVPEGAEAMLQLSRKTGLPLGVLPGKAKAVRGEERPAYHPLLPSAYAWCREPMGLEVVCEVK
jgi:hypothetical protein